MNISEYCRIYYTWYESILVWKILKLYEICTRVDVDSGPCVERQPSRRSCLGRAVSESELGYSVWDILAKTTSQTLANVSEKQDGSIPPESRPENKLFMLHLEKTFSTGGGSESTVSIKKRRKPSFILASDASEFVRSLCRTGTNTTSCILHLALDTWTFFSFWWHGWHDHQLQSFRVICPHWNHVSAWMCVQNHSLFINNQQ